ncbi:F-box protein At2g02240 isoform X2 [Ziziphus jujuba]|uniref:F-box protein At2g02240 isoform X2 n=1 Tax=Ziziphus jujuba TaxID=326968 RepID=A0ABM4A5K5_ZIZJJ|nr:F-box protein At2g02240 isoform X2 [Ziziphus jujuba]
MEITILPDECISLIISLTSPRDASRLSLVCSLFPSAVNSDVVWRKFLPHDYHQILSNSALASSMDSLSKKQLYFHISHHPVLVDNGNMSFATDKENGKKCYMISSRRLSIVWGGTPTYWLWKSLSAESRHSSLKVIL